MKAHEKRKILKTKERRESMVNMGKWERVQRISLGREKESSESRRKEKGNKVKGKESSKEIHLGWP